jgi:F-type H+-transporting ATPase subunit b
MSQTTTAPAETTGETSHTSEGTEAHGGVFPPLDSATFPSQILWLAVFFGLLYVLMSKLVLPRISAILQTRADRIESDLAKAKDLQEATAEAVKAYEKSLADARGKAQTIALETRNKLQAETDAERGVLEASLAKKISAAETKIAAAKTKAMAQVDGLAAETAAAIVEQLTGVKVTKTAAAKAVSGKA